MNIFFEMTYGIGKWLAGNFDYGTVGTILAALITSGVMTFGIGIYCIKTENFSGPIKHSYYLILISLAIAILLGTFWIVTLHPMYKAEDIVAKEVEKEIYASQHLAVFNRMQALDKVLDLAEGKYRNIEMDSRDNKRLERNQLTPQQIAKKALRSTVHIGLRERSQNVFWGSGSGFFIGPDLIATNFHVLTGVQEGKPKLERELEREFKRKYPLNITAKLVHIDDKFYEVTGYRAIDPKNDLAILEVKIARTSRDNTARGLHFPPPPLAVSWPGIGVTSKASLHIGDRVYTTGNPAREEGTFSEGQISNTLRPTLCKLENDNIKEVGKNIQVQIPIYGGNSGGPLLCDRGLVIGVIYSGRVIPQKYGPSIPLANLSFVVAGYHLKKLISQAKQNTVSQLPAKGTLCSANAHAALGHQLAKAGKYDLAIEKYTKAIALASGGFSIGYLHRGLAKKKLGRAFKVDLLVSEKLMEREFRLRPPTSTISKGSKVVKSKGSKIVKTGQRQIRRFFKFLRKIPL